MYNYFPFTTISNYTGTYSSVQTNSYNNPTGNICQPSDILKFNSGLDVWSQIPLILPFLNNELYIQTLEITDWTQSLKDEWFDDFLKYTLLYDVISPSQRTILFNLLEQNDIFQQLSSPSVAYVTRNDGVNGLIIDTFLTNEISIGLNVYDFDLIIDYANLLPNNDVLKNIIFTYYKKGKVLISNLCKVNYLGKEEIVWCFDGFIYKDYNISYIGIIPSLTNGGGNMFGEVKLAGNYIQAHYIVRKNVDDNDPTFGLCSGVGKPFCFGDRIVIIDTTCFTTNENNNWTWISNTNMFENIWHIADITIPELYYNNTQISEFYMPLRVIQFLIFDIFK